MEWPFRIFSNNCVKMLIVKHIYNKKKPFYERISDIILGFTWKALHGGTSIADVEYALCWVSCSSLQLLRPIYKQVAENQNAEIFSANTLLVILGTSLLTARVCHMWLSYCFLFYPSWVFVPSHVFVHCRNEQLFMFSISIWGNEKACEGLAVWSKHYSGKWPAGWIGSIVKFSTSQSGQALNLELENLSYTPWTGYGPLKFDKVWV